MQFILAAIGVPVPAIDGDYTIAQAACTGVLSEKWCTAAIPRKRGDSHVKIFVVR